MKNWFNPGSIDSKAKRDLEFTRRQIYDLEMLLESNRGQLEIQRARELRLCSLINRIKGVE